MTLGKKWTQQSEGKVSVASQLPDPDENAGRAFFRKAQENIVPLAIDSVAPDGVREVLIDAPISVMTTHAYVEFTQWAKAQDMDARFAGLIFGENKGDCKVVIRVTPVV